MAPKPPAPAPQPPSRPAADPDREARRQKRRDRRAAEAATEVQPETGAQAGAVTPSLSRPDPAALLGDIDAWDLRQEGDWLRFTARLEDHPRPYLRHRDGGAVLADAPGPLLAILGIGGPRAAGFTAGPPRFVHNIVAPGDHIGAVGAEGTAEVTPSDRLLPLPHRPAVALLADAALARRYGAKRGLPLILTRVETHAAADIHALAKGIAYENFLSALETLTAAAAGLSRPARVMAVTLDYGLEDLTSSAPQLAEGQRALMARLTKAMRARGLIAPPFLRIAESGTASLTDHPAIRADWELAWNPGPHRLLIAAPAYMAPQDAHGRRTEAGQAVLAAMQEEALHAHAAGEAWHCPLPLLAEYRGTEIRVTFRATSDLVIDPADPFGAGQSAGFHITGTDQPVKITALAPAPDDPRALILTTDRAPTGPAPRLLLACASPQGPNRSAIRDLWSAATPEDQILHRWALPADLPLRQGPAPKEAS